MVDKQWRYDIKGLAEELEFEVDEISELFSKYFDEMKKAIGDMNVYLEKKDWPMLERVVHNIKGVSANLNIYDVFNESEVFDKKLKVEDGSNAEAHVDKLTKLIWDAEVEITEIFVDMGIKL